MMALAMAGLIGFVYGFVVISGNLNGIFSVNHEGFFDEKLCGIFCGILGGILYGILS